MTDEGADERASAHRPTERPRDDRDKGNVDADGLDDGGPNGALDPERQRLRDAHEGKTHWYRWGPYLAERQWGTVREDYSADGTAWEYLPHDHARSRAYRWGEDGLLGISDEQQRLCFAIALWNEADPILKERAFGLTGNEGNHGEDVKEVYWYLDNTPTHSYMKALYRYPQAAFPYADLVDENRRRDRTQPEYELRDTGVLDANRFFDVAVEYAKVDAEDILIRIAITNQADRAAPIHLLPTLWFRNTWAWGLNDQKPMLRDDSEASADTGDRVIVAYDQHVGTRRLFVEGSPRLLFTENDTNAERLWGAPNPQACVKDAFHTVVVDGRPEAVSADGTGTKVAAWYRFNLAAGETREVLLRLTQDRPVRPFAGAAAVFDRARDEADTFYASLGGPTMTPDQRLVQRQAFAGLLWSKQFYHLDVARWLDGDPAFPPPPPSRLDGRNHEWRELNNADVLSMPDTWEYPWYAAWDLAFHCLPLAQVDPWFAKRQLLTLVEVWYQHPNGQLPAYEWAFSDVNPPVHAWAAWRVYKIDRRITGKADRRFLERVFLKLLLNFTWWVNRKDADGHNVFQGGFLGLDNIGVFDRSKPLPVAGHLGQADGTAWMGMYCLSMLAISLELAREEPVYEDMATKFFEHFLYIAAALNDMGSMGVPLWNDEDEFFYDVLHCDSGDVLPLRLRSLVGLVPLLAVETIEPDLLDRLPEFRKRLRWFLTNRPDLAALVSRWDEKGMGERRLLALVRGHRMKALLRRMLDPEEFLSDHGIRSISRHHRDNPYELSIGGQSWTVEYEPAESHTGTFGGNSNWRGPVWFPLNFLLIEALQRFHHFYGPDFKVECPTGSGVFVSLDEVAAELSRRLTSIFTPDADGRRPVFGSDPLATDPLWRDNVLFYEYFHGDTGAGLGASHQTGWTALVAKLLEQITQADSAAHDEQVLHSRDDGPTPPGEATPAAAASAGA